MKINKDNGYSIVTMPGSRALKRRLNKVIKRTTERSKLYIWSYKYILDNLCAKKMDVSKVLLILVEGFSKYPTFMDNPSRIALFKKIPLYIKELIKGNKAQNQALKLYASIVDDTIYFKKIYK